MIQIDGTLGEGGGQVLRTSLTLSALTGKPFRLVNLRAGRSRPGLRPQHLAAVRAAAAVAHAEVEGAREGSLEITFAPRDLVGGDHHVEIGTAGSATLVLQTILLPLLFAAKPSRVEVEGGTHNPLAPPFEFLDRVWRPALTRMGAKVALYLRRHGFFPAGGGRIVAEVEPGFARAPLTWLERGEVRSVHGAVLLAGLPLHIAEREAKIVERTLGWDERQIRIEPLPGRRGPGNAVLLEIECEHAVELSSAFGQRGVRAEAVARSAAHAVQRYLAARVPVGEHLADQLLVPLALAGGGRFRTLDPSSHARTQMALIPRFLDVAFELEDQGADRVEVRVVPG